MCISTSTKYSNYQIGVVFQVILYNSQEMSPKCSYTCADSRMNLQSAASTFLLIRATQLINVSMIAELSMVISKC
jgi:hypothetical protein